MRRLRGERIGLIPQRPMTSLSPSTSVGRQLRWHLGDIGDGELRELLTGVGLGTVLDRLDGYPFEFSGGQLQRLLIAVAALGKQPDLLLADEPTTTLDATVQAQVLRLLLELRERTGLATTLGGSTRPSRPRAATRPTTCPRIRAFGCCPVPSPARGRPLPRRPCRKGSRARSCRWTHRTSSSTW